MTITISIDPASLRRSADGVDFEFTEGVRRHRVHVPYEAIAGHLRISKLSADLALGFVRTHALSIALAFAGLIARHTPRGRWIAGRDILRKTR